MEDNTINVEIITESNGHGEGYVKIPRVDFNAIKDKPVPESFENLESEDVYEYMTDEEKQGALEKLGETAGMFLEALEKYAGSIFEKAAQELENSGTTGKIK